MSDDLVKRLRKNVMCGDAVIEEAADYIEKLERDILNYSSAVADAQMRNEELDRALNRIIDRWEAQKARIEKLEAALRLIAQNNYGLQGMMEDGTDTPEAKAEYYAGQVARRQHIARKALEGKDD